MPHSPINPNPKVNLTNIPAISLSCISNIILIRSHHQHRLALNLANHRPISLVHLPNRLSLQIIIHHLSFTPLPHSHHQIEHSPHKTVLSRRRCSHDVRFVRIHDESQRIRRRRLHSVNIEIRIHRIHDILCMKGRSLPHQTLCRNLRLSCTS